MAFFVWLLENFSKTEGLNVKIKGTSLLRAKWMYVCVFFVCFHCLPVFFFLFLFSSNNYLSLHTLRFYTGMLFCLFTKLKNTEYKCFSSFHIFWYTMTVVEIVLIDYCNYVLSSYFKKAYYLKKKAFFCQTFYDTSLFGNHFLSSVVLWIIRCVLFYLAFFIGFQNRTTTRRGASYWSSACMLLEPPSLFLNGWAPKDWTGAPPLWEVTER